jgi:hypothetical protein
LFPRDDLAAAECDFVLSVEPSNVDRPLHRNTCVTHLKQAIECAIDAFLDEAGVASGRALTRLNAIRNKIEHE